MNMRSRLSVLICLVFIVIGGIVVWIVNGQSLWANFISREADKSTVTMEQRVHKLWELARHSGGSSFETKLILQGSYLVNSSDWKAEAETWRKRVKINSHLIEKTERGAEVLRSRSEEASWIRDVLVFAEKDGRLYYTIHLTGQEHEGMKRVIAEGMRIQAALQEHEWTVTWNSEIRTELKIPREQLWEQMHNKMQQLGNIKALDDYEDDRTRSVSYETDYMGEGINMQSGHANLQMAVHEAAERGTTKLALGTPLIAGEY